MRQTALSFRYSVSTRKELLEDYHIFSIEGTYETGNFSEDRLIGRMLYYGTGNTDHEVTGIQFLTDNHGQAFREQVLTYMEECYGIGLIRILPELQKNGKSSISKGKKMRAEEEKLTAQFKELKEAAEEASSDLPDEELSDIPEDGDTGTGNPFYCLEQIEKSGLLSVVMPQDMELSGKEIDLENQVSMRGVNTGYGRFPARTVPMASQKDFFLTSISFKTSETLPGAEVLILRMEIQMPERCGRSAAIS